MVDDYLWLLYTANSGYSACTASPIHATNPNTENTISTSIIASIILVVERGGQAVKNGFRKAMHPCTLTPRIAQADAAPMPVKLDTPYASHGVGDDGRHL